MAGQPGRSGRRPRSLAEHFLRGTTPRGRPGLGLVPAPNPGRLPPDLLDGLDPEGRGAAFVAEVYATFRGWTVAKCLLLRECGLLIDALEASRGAPAEASVRRQFLATLAALNLRDVPAPPVAVAAPRTKWTDTTPA
jgi:hypothetical protein